MEGRKKGIIAGVAAAVIAVISMVCVFLKKGNE